MIIVKTNDTTIEHVPFHLHLHNTTIEHVPFNFASIISSFFALEFKKSVKQIISKVMNRGDKYSLEVAYI